jgi:thiamine-monophosphate kinase
VTDEAVLIGALRSAAERSPLQLNGAFEADAELVDVGKAELLALNVDTLHARSELVMCSSPYERGWLAVTATLSDIAAVGARPVAVLLSCSFAEASEEDARELGRGAAEAARAAGAHLVGGDTNWAGEDSITGCALGFVERDRVMTRVGAKPGDVLYVTGPVGAGNAAGARNMLGRDPRPWRPSARIDAGRAIDAHACIDTSDGLLSAALMLADVNDLGLELRDDPALYDKGGLELARELGLPSWMLAAAEWGEYELLYALPPDAQRRGDLPVGRLLERGECTIVCADGERVDARAASAALRAVEPNASFAEDLLAVGAR